MFEIRSTVTAVAATLSLVAASPALAAPGDLDPSFGTSGVVFSDINPLHGSTLDQLVVQPDGKIVVLEYEFDSGPTSHVRRYLPDGSPDGTFGIDGVEEVAPNQNAIALQPDGKIILAGSDGSDFVVTRLLASGHYDDDFDGDSGTANGEIKFSPTPGTDFPTGIGVDSKGRIVVAGAGNSGDATGAVAVARLLSSGKRDASFNNDGVATFDLVSPPLVAWGMAIQPDDKVVVTGGFADSGNRDTFVQRWTEAGTPDKTFGGASTGLKTYDLGPDDVGIVTAVQPDGRILVGSDSGNADRLIRVTASGALDGSFANGGDVPLDYDVGEITQQPDGKIVLLGDARQADGFASLVIDRRDANGSPDTSFGSGGQATLRFTPVASSIDRGLGIAPDGKIVVSGTNGLNAPVDGGLARVQGAPDPLPFPADPSAPPPAPAPQPAAPAPAPQPALALSKLSFSHRTFAVANAATARVGVAQAARARGTVIKYSLNRAANVSIRLKALNRGARSVTLKRKSSAGRNRVRFSGRIGRRALKPGRYRAVVRATDASGAKSEARSIRFKIVR